MHDIAKSYSDGKRCFNPPPFSCRVSQLHSFRQIESSNVEINQRVEKQKDLTIINIAGTFTLLSCVVTMFHMTAHLRKMNQPFVQRKICAILWMVRLRDVE